MEQQYVWKEVDVKDDLPVWKEDEERVMKRGNKKEWRVVEHINRNVYCCYTSLGVMEICEFSKDGEWEGNLNDKEVVTHWLKRVLIPQFTDEEIEGKAKELFPIDFTDIPLTTNENVAKIERQMKDNDAKIQKVTGYKTGFKAHAEIINNSIK